ncbi:MAG TPA: carboxypeptidase-like regulatory domain-containing protein [Terriglobales bacterium]|nr:carboxypeptidase-like regulatory domain-containing protein [Terriglobales bacterium]
MSIIWGSRSLRDLLWAWLSVIAICLALLGHTFGQTAATGAVTGLTLSPSRGVLPGVILQLAKEGGGTKSAVSDKNGRFGFLLLSPGKYQLDANAPGFEHISFPEINVHVTETVRLAVHLRIATRFEQAQVSSNPLMVHLDSSALGRVANENAVVGLPLATRNFAQIASLSPGVASGVSNAGELGLGGTALSQTAPSNDGIFVHGARSYENNWQLDGISVSDAQGSGSSSGGIPIPNPDSIQEFKVQTALYDAAYGRYAGANVSIITRIGSNDYHGTIFEFLRNDVLNANDFFLNQVGQSRQNLKQNQFGFSFGAPIKKDKLLAFASYQGTRQVNGVASGQARVACTSSLTSPPLTNDRSQTSLGKLFGGMKGALGGIAVKPDGSNINPAATALLNLKLPDGSFLIPTPQTVDPSRPFASQGFSVLTDPCNFDEISFW